jgi:hypothetical protein
VSQSYSKVSYWEEREYWVLRPFPNGAPGPTQVCRCTSHGAGKNNPSVYFNFYSTPS